MILPEEIWYPIEIEPPDRVGHVLSDGESGRLTVRYQLHPGNFRSWCIRRVAVNVRKFTFRYSRMYFGPGIHRDPKQQPDEANCACHNEGPAPAIGDRNPG